MSITSERALRKAMQDRSFERVYYFVGDDDFLKEATAGEFTGVALDAGTRDFNHQVLRGDDATAEQLDIALSTPPMFAARRLVTIREVHALKKAARAVLTDYLERPSPDLVLLLMAPAGEKADRLLLDRATVVDFEPLDPARVPAWIQHYAEKELGVSVTPEAARTLQEAAGPELAVLASELDKLASYAGGESIQESTIRDVVGVRKGETTIDLLDAVANREGGRAVALVPAVLAQSRTSVVTIIMALATQMLAVAWGRAARDRGVPPAGIERGYYGLLKSGRVFPGRPWKDAVGCWTRATVQWTSDELDRSLRVLLLADAAAKESRLSSEDQLLASLVLQLCTRTGHTAA